MVNLVRGAGTGVPLGDVTPLLLPWARDPWGALRPPVSVEAMRLSAELAAATYHMDIEPWVQAGWRDVTIQVDNDLLTDFLPRRHSGAVSRLTANWRMRRVRAKLRQRNPIGQVAGALRQIKQSDTGKVLVMIHPAPGGRYVVAVSFMGTGSRFYDWFSNFRMNSQDGIHKGFLQLARQFEGNEERILFPQTARELGVEKWTLGNILEEATHQKSRFTLWITGHSQGGAVMQVWVYHKMLEDGVLPQNLLGYGFASPSALEGRAMPRPEVYPLYHVLNGDDLVPRMGAQVHLGVCLLYPTDAALRSACYAWPRDTESVRRRKALYPLLVSMVDTPACMAMVLAYLDALAAHTPEEMFIGLDMLGMGKRLPLGRLLVAAESRMEQLIGFLRRHIVAAYASITGSPMDGERVAQNKARILQLMDEMGVRGFASALSEWMSWPHSMQVEKNGMQGAYVYIARLCAERMRPFIWEGGARPRRRYADAWEDGGELLVRRRLPGLRRVRGAKRFSHLRPSRGQNAQSVERKERIL